MRDHLRRPAPDDPTRGAYKEWLHVNAFDHGTGVIALVNVSVHGDPVAPASRAVGAALVHVPDVGWLGNAEVSSARSVEASVLSLATEGVAIAVDPSGGRVAARARLAGDGVDLSLEGVPVGAQLGAASVMPFGTGHLGWYVYPRLALDGTAALPGGSLAFSGVGGYADHNWGRWWWGDDAGWDWACWHAPDALLVVFSRMTNSAHTSTGLVLLTVEVGGRVVRFVGDQVLVEASGRRGPSRRLPGALAALHTDRAAERLPSRVVVHASNGFDGLDLEFDVRDVAQLVMAEPARPGFGFLHELVGAFRCVGTIAGTRVDSVGLGVVERAG
ncbi:hypothetical protein [Cellulomonas sp. ICMP 17802]|uniref:hypothetical protein n=1 Tax=Cellulomonas sp. ICMP 17802 TaxID=3239199 RepID=UPI00351B4892